jgi:hypothetical protein
MPVPIPVQNADKTPVIPGTGSLTASGGGASGVQDWWVHIQTVDLMYMRSNQQNMSVSSPVAGPAVQSNYLDVAYTVNTVDEVYENTAFSGELFKPQTLELVTAVGTSGGFGVCGVVNTSAAGYIRRVVRKDAAGNVLDPTGVCVQKGSCVIDQMPGAYDQAFDTSYQVNSNLVQVMAKVDADCPNFIVSLVDL